MSDQPNDIAEECEQRMSHLPGRIWNQLRKDLSRYAAHMRQQHAEIERLRGIIGQLKQTADGKIQELCAELWFIGRDGAIYKKHGESIPPDIMDKRWANQFFSSRDAAAVAWDIAEAKR